MKDSNEQISTERCEDLLTEIIIQKNIGLFNKLKQMKTIRKVPFELVEVEFIPEPKVMELGKFYYSEEYKTSSHLCACGCGKHIPVPIKEGEWQILNKGKLTVTPSLKQRFDCRAHYVIIDGAANILREGIPSEYWVFGYGFEYAQPGE